MFLIELAGVRVRVENRFPYVEAQCKDFLCAGEQYDFSVSVSPEEIAEERTTGDFSDGYCESICTYRHICDRISDYNVFLLHSSVIEVDGYAYAFTAKSGVGKSTHTALWLKNVPHARVLNGDKPLYRLEADGSLTVFGTPWNGKEGWGQNISAPLAAICFIERGTENTIRKAEEIEVVSRLVHQLYLRGERRSVDQKLMLMDGLVRAVPYYVLACTISDEAAHLAWSTMRKS
ncbi:MAG: hypothetical protein E7666_04745 [Ruminococcaceae bacterium]|nr:hypothetical protein [Oscillospiraceae bacterium]